MYFHVNLPPAEVLFCAHLEIRRSVLPEVDPADAVTAQVLMKIRFRVISDHGLTLVIDKERIVAGAVFSRHGAESQDT